MSWTKAAFGGGGSPSSSIRKRRLIAAAGSEILESGGEALQKGIERAVELLEEIFR